MSILDNNMSSVSIHIHLRLRPGEDDDLLEFFSKAGLKCKARAVKAALRMGGLPEGDSFLEVVEDEAEDALDDLLI